MEYSETVKKTLPILRIFYVVFLVQPLFLLFINSQRAGFGPLGISSFDNTAHRVFLVASILALVFGTLVRRLMRSPSNARRATNQSLESILKTQGTLTPERLHELERLSPTEQNMYKVASPYFISFILSCVAFETSTLLGFVTSMQAENLSLMIPFMAITYVGMATNFPSLDQLKNFAESGR